MLNKFFMILLLCLGDLIVFAHPTYCFNNNNDLDAQIDFTNGVQIQQLYGYRYTSEQSNANSIIIPPHESVIVVSSRKIEGLQKVSPGYRVEESKVDPAMPRWGGFQDNSELSTFKAIYGKDIRRAFKVTEGATSESYES